MRTQPDTQIPPEEHDRVVAERDRAEARAGRLDTDLRHACLRALKAERERDIFGSMLQGKRGPDPYQPSAWEIAHPVATEVATEVKTMTLDEVRAYNAHQRAITPPDEPLAQISEHESTPEELAAIDEAVRRFREDGTLTVSLITIPQSDHDNDERPSAINYSLGPASYARVCALGFEPGSANPVEWVITRLERAAQADQRLKQALESGDIYGNARGLVERARQLLAPSHQEQHVEQRQTQQGRAK